MTGRAYPRLPVEQFGDQLIASGDLDPVYVALAAMGMPREQLARWLIAYWCMYHPGSASWFSELPEAEFWGAMMEAAVNTRPAPTGDRWPRAPERRHWRGLNAVRSVESLHSRGMTAMGVVTSLYYGLGDPAPYAAVAERVRQFSGFGPWVAYKVGDMLERVWGAPVRITGGDAMYEEPVKGALLVWRTKQGLPAACRVKDEERAVNVVVGHLLSRFGDRSAPGLPGRACGVQEVETVLCKWKSHVGGHYPLNNDLVEIRRGAEPWASVSPTAAAFLNALPRVATAEALAH